jgi:hypothetical protein
MKTPLQKVSTLLVSLVLLGGSLIPAAAGEETCAADAASAASDMVERWRISLASGNADSLASLYHKDTVIVDRMLGVSQIHGRASARAFYANLLTRHPMARVTLGEVTAGCKTASSDGVVLVHVAGRRKGTRMLLMGKFRLVVEHSDVEWLITRHELELAPRPNRIAADQRQ